MMAYRCLLCDERRRWIREETIGLISEKGKDGNFQKKLRKYLIVNYKFQSLDIFLTLVFQLECKME